MLKFFQACLFLSVNFGARKNFLELPLHLLNADTVQMVQMAQMVKIAQIAQMAQIAQIAQMLQMAQMA